MTKALTIILTKCLVNLLFQLEYADDDKVDSDFAVRLMEEVGVELRSLERSDAEALISLINKLATEELTENRRMYFNCFPKYFGISNLS